jgi:hypothetical protein
MNKWQMSKDAPLKPWGQGGSTQDSANKTHYSIHRMGRTDEHRKKQRAKRRAAHGGQK